MKKFNKIFLVDDDDITIYLNETLLNNMEVSSYIESFTDSLQALHSVEECSIDNGCPDLILLDLNMPGPDGFEFLQAFNNFSSEKKDNTQIVILTSSTNPKDIQRVKDLGYEQILNKPLNKEKIESVI